MSDLIIVESPAKAKTIGKYLGKNFKVMASVGHIRDLPKSKLGVDIEQDFKPMYENKKDKTALIRDLKKQADKSKSVYLATDPDREGEAISWHLAHILDLDAAEPIRVTFNEITKTGVKDGMAHPRGLDMGLVNAQQARRILDRIVGYKLSPFLWKKVRRGLSAGRVQSVAVRLVVDREKEIESFKSREYWSIDATLLSSVSDAKKLFPARLSEVDGVKAELNNKEDTDKVLKRLEGASFNVSAVKKSTRKKLPAPPFTTSTLQQEASRKLFFNSRRTMKIAQELYEGLELPEHGAIGLITYMRTDSVRISAEAKQAAKELIEQKFGAEYVFKGERLFKSKAGGQDAHEAIRPTVPHITPEQIKSSVTSDQYKLYKLIWERFMASQMENAQLNTVSVDINANGCLFKANGYTVKFDGFMKLYVEASESENPEKSDDADNAAGATALPPLTQGEELSVESLDGNQHFTQPPGRYTEAGLIKALEENGIGRPSTYAPTITTILDRQYVERVAKQLKPTILGRVITDFLKEHFDNIVDTSFTAQMETYLDKIEVGSEEWVEVLREFYGDFEKTLSKAETEMEGKRVKIPDEPTDIPCELCGKMMSIKIGPYGKFLGCSGFPECKQTKKIINEADGECPSCGGKMVSKKSKKGKPYFGCENVKDCGFMTWDVPVSDICPNCQKKLFRKGGKKGTLYCAAESCSFEQADTEAETNV
ncbi:MAG: type I DNA topoisomerase [Oscillospiraceae bacterium]|nr:type I DNA topoisomerase [Oscillospiraceae bacterium]